MVAPRDPGAAIRWLRNLGREIGGVESLIRRKHQLSADELRQCARLSTWSHEIHECADTLEALLTLPVCPQPKDEATK